MDEPREVEPWEKTRCRILSVELRATVLLLDEGGRVTKPVTTNPVQMHEAEIPLSVYAFFDRMGLRAERLADVPIPSVERKP
jgi:hypothetical protein